MTVEKYEPMGREYFLDLAEEMLDPVRVSDGEISLRLIDARAKLRERREVYRVSDRGDIIALQRFLAAIDLVRALTGERPIDHSYSWWASLLGKGQ